MRIVLPEALRELAGGRAVVEVAASATAGDGASGPVADDGHTAGDDGRTTGDDGRTVGGTLGTLRASHPGLYDRLMTEQGALRPHVNIFVDGENIRFTGGLGTVVGAGSEILVLPAISGG